MRKLYLLLLVLTCAAGAQDEHHRHQHHHDFSDVERYIKRFEDPAREAWQQPDKVVESLKLRPGQNVADIGAGSGYFTRRFARAVHPGGFAVAVDVEPGFFPYVAERAREAGQNNIFTLRADNDNPHLEEKGFDLVFICNTVHHMEDRVSYFRTIAPALREGGRLVVVDFFKDRDIPVGPGPAMRLTPESLTAELEQAGYAVEVDEEMLPYQYILTARLTGR